LSLDALHDAGTGVDSLDGGDRMVGMSRDKFKPGDRVVALLTWGWVIGPGDHAEYILVALDTGFIQAFHWAECYAEADVVEVK
jgi:hypothetical protein